MLVLTRKTDEAVAIGSAGLNEHFLKITVLGVGPGTVRLGFEADSSVPIHRWEVWQRIHGNDGVDKSVTASNPANLP